MKKVLIIGATSAIAEATARLFAERGDRLYLLARNQERLQSLAADLKIRGAQATGFAPLDVSDCERHRSAVEEAVAWLGGIDLVLIAHGTLPDQGACEQDFALAREALTINGLATLSLLTVLAEIFARQGQGVIAVISSVAGDRGRQSNYVYGAAKAMVTIFLQGLRNRLSKAGVHVLTIKPGQVDTPMTVAFTKGLLWAQPQQVARDIVRAIDKKKNVLYTPWFWRFIMLIIRLIPEGIFKKMRL